MSNDPSLSSGIRDEQTVTPEGKPVATTIDGVKVRSTPHHVDHRGTVFEMFEGVGDYWDEPVVYAYQFLGPPPPDEGLGPARAQGRPLHDHLR